MWGSGHSDEEEEFFSPDDTSRVGQGLAVDLVLLPGYRDPRPVDRAPPPFSFDRVQTPSSLKLTAAEKAETGMLVEKVVQLINQGVTGMDLLEVFLSRRIQPLQARDHSMWMYSGAGDTARVHPEEVEAKTVAEWLRGITGNKDNPRGARRVNPFSNSNLPDRVWSS